MAGEITVSAPLFLRSIEVANARGASLRERDPNGRVISLSDGSRPSGSHGAKFFRIDLRALSIKAAPPPRFTTIDITDIAIPICANARTFPDSPTKTSVVVRLADCGILERVLLALEKEFVDLIDNNRDVLVAVGVRRNQMHTLPLISRSYVTNTKNGLHKAGETRDEPMVFMPFSLDVYPARFSQAGKRRSIIYDWASRSPTEDGKDVFSELIGVDGKSINAENCGDIIRMGDVVKRIALKVESIVAHNGGISLRYFVSRVWTQRTATRDDEITVLHDPDEMTM